LGASKQQTITTKEKRQLCASLQTPELGFVERMVPGFRPDDAGFVDALSN
jgi:hypothetical protein